MPAFVGLGAPHWDSEARALLTGMTRGTTRRELARAALECVAYQTRDLLDAMQADLGDRLARGDTVIRVDGGMSASDWTMQFLADILAAPVDRPAYLETTALGAAYLAGMAAGLYPDAETFAAGWSAERRFEPAMPAAGARDRNTVAGRTRWRAPCCGRDFPTVTRLFVAAADENVNRRPARTASTFLLLKCHPLAARRRRHLALSHRRLLMLPARAQGPDQIADLDGRNRTAEQVALHHAGTLISNDRKLPLNFHALCDRCHAEGTGKPDDGTDDDGRILVHVDIADEGPVDLDRFERKAAQDS